MLFIIVLIMTEYILSYFCTCVKWNRHPLIVTWGSTDQNACHVAAS